jgi:hypothetical protein
MRDMLVAARDNSAQRFSRASGAKGAAHAKGDLDLWHRVKTATDVSLV